MPVFRQAVLYVARRPVMEGVVTRNPLFRPLVQRFVAGDDMLDAIDSTRALNARGFTVTLDHLGESVVSKSGASDATAAQIELLHAIRANDLDANISIKLTQLGLMVERGLATENLRRIVERANESGTFVRIDMESSQHTQATLDIADALRVTGFHNVGVVIQACLHRSAEDIERLIGLGTRVRLCKGAYAEPPAVAISRKAAVDGNFVRLAEQLLRSGNYPAMATHDERIVRHIVAFARTHGISPTAFEFQMLFGVRRDLQAELLAQGFRVRVYVPFGTAWYPYLTRRLAERPANLIFFLKSAVRA